MFSGGFFNSFALICWGDEQQYKIKIVFTELQIRVKNKKTGPSESQLNLLETDFGNN